MLNSGRATSRLNKPFHCLKNALMFFLFFVVALSTNRAFASRCDDFASLKEAFLTADVVFTGKADSQNPRTEFNVDHWYKGAEFSTKENQNKIAYGTSIESPFFPKADHIFFGDVEKIKDGGYKIWPSLCNRTAPIPNEAFLKTIAAKSEELIAVTGHVSNIVSDESKKLGHWQVQNTLNVHILSFTPSASTSVWDKKPEEITIKSICPAHYQAGHDYLFLLEPQRSRQKTEGKYTNTFNDFCPYVFELDELKKIDDLSKEWKDDTVRKREKL